MAGNQLNNITILDLTTGLTRTLETGGTPDTLQIETDLELLSGANMLVDGNLVVNGTTTTLHSEQVNIRDNHLYLNADYTTAGAQTGGLVVNVLPTATADTVAATGFTAGVAAVSNPTVITAGSATFSAGDIVQVSGANDQENDGIYEVESHVGTTLTIRGVGTVGTTQDWVQNDFVTDTTVAGAITLVNVNVLRGNSSGDWETATTTTTSGLTYNIFTQQGVVDLQEAYEAGNTITTDAGNGNVIIAGTELLSITTTGGIDLDTVFDADVTTFDVQMTGTNGFSIDGTDASNVSVTSGDLTLSTITSGSLVASSAADVDVDATTSMTFDTADAADASGNDITMTAGSSTGGTAGGASIVLTPGDGNTTGVAGFVNITSPADEDEILFQIESTGTGANAAAFFTGTSDPSGAVTADAGSMFLRDTGAGAVAYLNTSTGSGTSWTPFTTGAGNNLQQAYEAGNTIVTDTTNGDFDVSGTEAISLDASSASNFTVDSADLVLSTTTSGELDLTSAGLMDVNAGAGLDIDVTGAFDMLSTGAFSIDGTGASNVSADTGDLTLSTTTSGSVLVDGVDGVEINSTGGALQLGNDADTGAINVGTGAAARTITVGNATGATSVNLDSGTGAFTFDSTVGEASALMTLTATGTGGDSVGLFVGDNDPDTVVTGLAGSLFMRDTGTGGELYINTSTGSGTSWTQVATGGSVTLQNAYEGGNTIATDATNGDFDVSGTQAISLDASLASNFTVAGADLTLSTTTSGTIDITSAEDVQVTVGTNNATAMVIDDGTDNLMTFDTTTGELAVEVNEFLDIVGNGAGVTLTAGEALSAGEVVTIEGTTGDVILADSNTGTTLDGLAIGVAAYAAADTDPVKVYTVPGSLIPVNFAAAPAASLNGRPVFVSATAGEGTTTAPTGSGNVVYVIGILQGANGANTSPLVMFQPQFISVRP